jgi:hypothetical protein
LKQNSSSKTSKSQFDKLFKFVFAITLVKFIIIFNIEPVAQYYSAGAWLGSDTDGYVQGAKSIATEGFFTKSRFLSYYAPGYPIFIWLVETFFGPKTFLVISILQTIFYSFSIYLLAKQIFLLGLHRIAVSFILLALLNPMLSLSSMQLGYESLVASLISIILALLIKNYQYLERKKMGYEIVLVSVLMGISNWFAPRMILTNLIVLIFYAYYLKNKSMLLPILCSICIVITFQLSINARNYIAVGSFTSQTSLGNLAIMGAGPSATGTYKNSPTGVTCLIESENEASQSTEKLKCAINWYAENPFQGARLLLKKSYHLWSPWFGPLAGGTNALHPYLQSFHPIKSNITSQQQFDLIFGPIGKMISWLWIIGGWILLVLGLMHLWSRKESARITGLLSILLICLNWISALITIGDSRYRIPLMSVSLLLQVIGLSELMRRVSRNKNRK